MHWQSYVVPGEASPSGLITDAERVAGMRIESEPPEWIRIVCGQRPLLWARIEQGWQGTRIVRADSTETPPVIQPIRASTARTILAKATGTTSATHWMKFFADQLTENAASPLGPGRWQLTELRPDRRWNGHQGEGLIPANPESYLVPAFGLEEALALPRVVRLGWGSTRSTVVPLREPLPLHAGRLKAMRKFAREGTLPPLLLWWVSPLDAYLILDGHVRLQAAILEGVAPSVVALWQSSFDVQDKSRWQEAELRRYEQVFQFEDRPSLRSRRELNHSLASAFRDHRFPSCTARYVPGLGERWLEEVAAVVGEGRQPDGNSLDALLAPPRAVWRRAATT